MEDFLRQLAETETPSKDPGSQEALFKLLIAKFRSLGFQYLCTPAPKPRIPDRPPVRRHRHRPSTATAYLRYRMGERDLAKMPVEKDKRTPEISAF